MRHGRGVVLAAVLLAGLTGCADRPNDLESYYDTPAGSPSATPSSRAASPAQAPAADPAAAAQKAIADQVTDAVLTNDDLAHEGVRPATRSITAGDCFTAVPSGDPRAASWTYTSGSTLLQQVSGYLDRPAGEVLDQVRCDGQKLNLPLPAGAEAVSAWCQGTTCTVLLASGHVLSGLQVTASSLSRATDAVKSLAPLAAKKLPVQP